jgi:hypothetical protein
MRKIRHIPYALRSIHLPSPWGRSGVSVQEWKTRDAVQFIVTVSNQA